MSNTKIPPSPPPELENTKIPFDELTTVDHWLSIGLEPPQEIIEKEQTDPT